MRAAMLAMLVLVFFGLASSPAPAQQNAGNNPHPPLRKKELLALVAGAALSANIVQAIQADGLAFQRDDTFRTLMTTAGADVSVLNAVSAAKITVTGPPLQPEDIQRLRHIANAGHFIEQKNYAEASKELAAEIDGDFEKCLPGS
jgi:hypothetical protein